MSSISYIYGTESDKYNAYTIYRDGRRLEPEPLAEYIEKLESRIVELESKQRWIPVSEPPKESGEYFTLTQVEGENFVGTAVYEKKHNHWWNDLGDRDDITHWMTLPEPPEESEK